jgi:hypothetical protein
MRVYRSGEVGAETDDQFAVHHEIIVAFLEVAR